MLADIATLRVTHPAKPHDQPSAITSPPALLNADCRSNAVSLCADNATDRRRQISGTVTDGWPNSCGRRAWEAIGPTKLLFAAARQAGLPVIYTTAPAASAVTATNRRAGLGSSDEDYGIFHEFAPEDGDIMIVKERASAFYGTPLIPELTRRGVSSLIVCGESTSGCVRASVVDAFSAGFHVTIAEECVFDRSLLSHKVNLFDLHHKYADVMHAPEIVERLREPGLAA